MRSSDKTHKEIELRAGDEPRGGKNESDNSFV
jgi:hypothetical protein